MGDEAERARGGEKKERERERQRDIESQIHVLTVATAASRCRHSSLLSACKLTLKSSKEIFISEKEAGSTQ